MILIWQHEQKLLHETNYFSYTISDYRSSLSDLIQEPVSFKVYHVYGSKDC